MPKILFIKCFHICGPTCPESYAIYPLRQHRNIRFASVQSTTTVVKNAAANNIRWLWKIPRPTLHYNKFILDLVRVLRSGNIKNTTIKTTKIKMIFSSLIVISLLETMYNLDMKDDIYWSKQRRNLITYITRNQVVYDMSYGTMPYTSCIVPLDIANMFRTMIYDV